MERSEANETRGTRQGEKGGKWGGRERGRVWVGGRGGVTGGWREMKIRGTQASSWRSLAIFLGGFNQADDRLPLTNATPELAPSPAAPSSAVKPVNQRANAGLSPRKLQLQEGKQSPAWQRAPRLISLWLSKTSYLF